MFSEHFFNALSYNDVGFNEHFVSSQQILMGFR